MLRLLCMLYLGLLSTWVWATDIPDLAELQYSGSYGIPAEMTFKRQNNQYTITASINVPFYQIRFESGGQIEGSTLKPNYYKDIRNGKLYASATMNDQQVSFGRGNHLKTQTVAGPVMDLFTLSWQLAFNGGKLPEHLTITNGKKLYQTNGVVAAGSVPIKVAGKSTMVNQLHVRRGDDTVQYAFAPALGGVPAVIHYDDGDKSYQLRLKSVRINGVVIKP